MDRQPRQNVMAIFLDLRRFIEVRRPELLPEATALYEGSLSDFATFLNQYFPHPSGDWATTNPFEAGKTLRELYPNGNRD